VLLGGGTFSSITAETSPCAAERQALYKMSAACKFGVKPLGLNILALMTLPQKLNSEGNQLCVSQLGFELGQ
jgi:hypothetical protein